MVVSSRGLSWSYEKLKKLLVATKGVATYPVVQFLKEHLQGTKLIFVVGESGSGKTSILSDITEQGLGVGHLMGSGTIKHGIWPCIIEEQQYLFVDTPGFGAGDLDNNTVFNDIMSCLFAVGPFVTTVGVIFLHDITESRMTAGEMMTLHWLQCFCGPQFYKRITIITSKWDVYTKARDKKLALSRLEELNEKFLKPILEPPHGISGGRLYNNGLLDGDKKNWEEPLDCIDDQKQRAEAVRRLIHNRYGNVDEVSELQIRTELDFGCRLRETEAAKVLNASATKTTVVTLRKKAILMDLDASFEPSLTTLKCDKKAEPEQATPFYESPMEEFFKKGDVYAWLDIAKQVAGLFMIRKANVSEKVTRMWEGIKDWWFGSSSG